MNQLDKILEERGNKYGDFKMLSDISQRIKELWYMSQNESFKEPTDAMNEAMEMVIHKLARCFNGDRYYKDNIVDAINYLRLYLNEIEKEDKEELVKDTIVELDKKYNFK